MKDYFNEVLIILGIYDEEVFNYYFKNCVFVPCLYKEFEFGCFPLYKENVLYDVKIVSPLMVDYMTIAINIHEYTHLYDLFYNVNKEVNINLDAFEDRADFYTKKYMNYELIKVLKRR